jgi:P-type Cu+ transporter
MIASVDTEKTIKCYHCGEFCDEKLWLGDKSFCCYGCKTVYEILSANELCEYYDLEKNPGLQIKQSDIDTYEYLDDPDIRKKVLEFDSANFSKVSFLIPAIHCVSCIWLLENLHKIEKGVLRTEVNFAQKTVVVSYSPECVKLSTIACLLSSLGYTPKITLDAGAPEKPKTDRTLVMKVAVAGFCFGNVMLFSFPEYLGIDHSEKSLMEMFSWLNLLLSIPVYFYSGWRYVTAAVKSFRQKQINIDVPIAAGLTALFLRSSYDIATGTGPGYFDSFTGLVFFLLIGRWFQNKTYETLAFNRDFTAYFPLAVNKLVNDQWKPVIIYKLKRKDIVHIRNMELIPADSTLLDETAYIDYSFVTGESRPVKALKGNVVYAGGRLIGTPVTLVVEKETSQSHLTSLWNNEAFRKVSESKFHKIIDSAARKFTWIVLVIAAATSLYWYQTSPSQTWLVLTSVLMVACPCALALAAPFTYGSMLRVFGKHGLYLKNADVIERMAAIDAVVFDKTGTVTHGSEPQVEIVGQLTTKDLGAVKTLTGYSTHPLSKLITKNIGAPSGAQVSFFRELPGQGIEGFYEGDFYRIGSAAFIRTVDWTRTVGSKVFVSRNDVAVGLLVVRTSVRKNISQMLRSLGKKCVALVSGDGDSDRAEMRALFPGHARIVFNQAPQEKLAYIKELQQTGSSVLMVGDGLNDSGALKQSDVGIAITDDSGVFTPASDGILYGNNLIMLDRFLDLAKSSALILKWSFAISFFYNAIALSFAASGNLTPLVAAILMPISSVSVVSFSTVAVNITARKKLGAPADLDEYLKS